MSTDLVGSTLGGRYQLTKLLGRGGMGAVYEARDQSLGRLVAVKVLLEPSASPSLAERFYREALAAARLSHVNIIQVTDFGPAAPGQAPFIVMERLQGETLQSLLERERSLSIVRALSIASQTASAAGAAHAAGVIHRDIKPDNLFLVPVDDTDVVKVFDFGIAKVLGEAHTTAGAVLGTVSYMSPEQALAEAVGPPADVWSIGVVLFQLLSGVLPIQKKGIGEVVSAILRGEIVSIRAAAPSVPDDVARIVERALARDPSARFANGHQMFAAIQAARERFGELAGAPTARGPLLAAGAEPPMAPSEETIDSPRTSGTLQMPAAPKRPPGS